MKLNITFKKTSFYAAVENGNMEIIKLFLNNIHLDINKRNTTFILH